MRTRRLLARRDTTQSLHGHTRPLESEVLREKKRKEKHKEPNAASVLADKRGDASGELDDTAHHSPPLSCPHFALEAPPGFRLASGNRRARALCCHGGSAAPPPAAGHVHRLRGGVLRVQARRARRDDAEGDRLRLRQRRRLRLDHAERAVLRQRQQAGGLLLHHQQLLPAQCPQRRHLRLRRRRHPHHHRPQLRQLQVRLRPERRRQRHGHRRDRRRHRHRRGYRSRHRHRRRYRDEHWSSRYGHGSRDRRNQHGHRHGDHNPWKHPEPTVRRRLRPVGQQHGPRLQRGRAAARRRAPSPCRRAPGHRRASPFPLRLIIKAGAACCPRLAARGAKGGSGFGGARLPPLLVVVPLAFPASAGWVLIDQCSSSSLCYYY